MQKTCKTCESFFTTKRKDKTFCSRLCYRRSPEVAKQYSNRTATYIKLHAKEPKRRWQKLVYKCKHESKELKLTQAQCEQLWNTGCHYCNKDILEETGCGLDRLDNNLGYVFENVVPCCGSCNKIKNVYFSHAEMKIAMKAVLEYRNDRSS